MTRSDYENVRFRLTNGGRKVQSYDTEQLVSVLLECGVITEDTTLRIVIQHQMTAGDWTAREAEDVQEYLDATGYDAYAFRYDVEEDFLIIEAEWR